MTCNISHRNADWMEMSSILASVSGTADGTETELIVPITTTIRCDEAAARLYLSHDLS